MSSKTTPRQLLPPDALDGFRVAVSSSESPDLARLGLLVSHFRLALGEIARAVLVHGGRLQFCGHLDPDGLTAFLVDEVKRFGRRGDTLSVLLAWPVHRQLSRETIERAREHIGLYGSLTCLDVDGAVANAAASGNEPVIELSQSDVARGLTSMRAESVGTTQGRVVLGGRRSGYRGRMPGIAEEALLTLRAGKPLFLAGGFGGVTLDLIRALKPGAAAWLPPRVATGTAPAGDTEATTEFARLSGDAGFRALNNGLNEEENLQMAMTYRPSEIASLVALGLGRLAQRSRVAEAPDA